MSTYLEKSRCFYLYYKEFKPILENELLVLIPHVADKGSNDYLEPMEIMLSGEIKQCIVKNIN
jgi:hypothetical protein